MYKDPSSVHTVDTHHYQTEKWDNVSDNYSQHSTTFFSLWLLQSSLLTNRVIGRTWGTIQWRSSSSLSCRRLLWAVLVLAGTSPSLVLSIQHFLCPLWGFVHPGFPLIASFSVFFSPFLSRVLRWPCAVERMVKSSSLPLPLPPEKSFSLEI